MGAVMNMPDWPARNTLVEVSVPTGQRYPSRVADAGERRMSLAAPVPADAGAPHVGEPLTIRWAAGPRGRYALPVTLAATTRTPAPVWVVQVAGPTQIEQDRHFVRGGGGEAVRLRRVGDTGGQEAHGHIVDVGEGSVRGRFTDLAVQPGEQVQVQMSLGDAVVPATGRVLQVTTTTDRPLVEVVAVYEVPEDQAREIRQYVLRQQVLTRTRTAGG